MVNADNDGIIVEKIKKYLIDHKINSVVIYGCGSFGKILIDVLLQIDGLEIVSFLDGDSTKQGSTYKGIPILAPVEYSRTTADLLISSVGDDFAGVGIAKKYSSHYKIVTTMFDFPFFEIRKNSISKELEYYYKQFDLFYNHIGQLNIDSKYDSNEILLINPPREIPMMADYPPIGLHYLHEFLKSKGYNSKVIDAASFSWKELGEVIKNSNALYFGVACWTIERYQSFNTIKLIRKLKPEAKIIAGGQHATAFPEHVISFGADYVCLGEGEYSLYTLIEKINAQQTICDVPGIAYKDETEVIRYTCKSSLIDKLDEIPFPKYEDVDFSKYRGLPKGEVNGPAAAIITSRGCPYECIYCSSSAFWQRKWHFRSADNVLAEIKHLYHNKGIRNFIFFDDNFVVNKERAIEVCQGIIEAKLIIRWVALTRVNNINFEVLQWMKNSGCYRIDFGVESGSPAILKNIKKGFTVDQIEEAFSIAHSLDIKPRAYLMIGNPGENEVTVDETARLWKKIQPYNSEIAQILWILPNTQIYEFAKQKSIINDNYWIEKADVQFYTGELNVEELTILQQRFVWTIND